MAIGATANWEFRAGSTAANVNGGFYIPGSSGTDYSQQNAAQYNLTNVTTSGATAILLTASASADMVGNGAHVISGTNFTVGWYQIISVVVGVSITCDRNVATGIGATGVINVGGGMSLNSATANQTDTNLCAALVAGNTVWVKGALTVNGSPSVTIGSAGIPIVFNGYQTTHGDNPTGANRPSLNMQTTGIFGLNTRNQMNNVILTGSSAIILNANTDGFINNCKVTNTSITAAQAAISIAGANALIQNTEAISYRGNAIAASVGVIVDGCYIHDSNIGFSQGGAAAMFISDSIISSCVTAAITTTATSAFPLMVKGCTLYGAENKLGTGAILLSGVTDAVLLNTIIYGFTTGINDANASGNNMENYNDFFNNTTNRTNISTGANSITTNPSFTSVAQITGTNGTTSGSVLTSSGANFGSVTDNVDFCYLVSGTGITAGQYLITAHTTTTLTLDIAPGTNATADKVFQVTTGHNFAPSGAGLNGTAFPGVFQAGLTTSSSKIGAVQTAGGASAATTSAVF